jgi:hypothetical protein
LPSIFTRLKEFEGDAVGATHVGKSQPGTISLFNSLWGRDRIPACLLNAVEKGIKIIDEQSDVNRSNIA